MTSADPQALAITAFHTVVAPAADPQITTWEVAGDQAPLAGSIAGDSYDWAMATANTSEIGAARLVGFKGAAPAAKAGYHVFVTLGQPDFAHSEATLTIPAAVSLAVGDTYTLRLEVYKTGQAVDTDTPVATADWVITATAHPAITAFHVEGDPHPRAGSLEGAAYDCIIRYRYVPGADVPTLRIAQFRRLGDRLGTTDVALVSIHGWGRATVVISDADPILSVGDQYTLRAELYKDTPEDGSEPDSYWDYIIAARLPPGLPSERRLEEIADDLGAVRQAIRDARDAESMGIEDRSLRRQGLATLRDEEARLAAALLRAKSGSPWMGSTVLRWPR